MAKYKPRNEHQRGWLPISLQGQVLPSTLEPTINERVEKHIDISVFGAI